MAHLSLFLALYTLVAYSIHQPNKSLTMKGCKIHTERERESEKEQESKAKEWIHISLKREREDCTNVHVAG